MDDSSSDEDMDTEADKLEEPRGEALSLPQPPMSTNVATSSSSSSTVQQPTTRPVYEVEKVTKQRYRQGWKFLTFWKGFPVSAATWEPLSTFVLPNWELNDAFLDFCRREGLDSLIRAAENYARLRQRETVPSDQVLSSPEAQHEEANIKHPEEEDIMQPSSVIDVDLDLAPDHARSNLVSIETPENMQRHVHFQQPMCTFHEFGLENFPVSRKRAHSVFTTRKHEWRETHSPSR